MTTEITQDSSERRTAGSLERVVSEQTFADQIRLAAKARKYSKAQLVAELKDGLAQIKEAAK